MKRKITLLVLTLAIFATVNAQESSFVIDFTGDFSTIDLSDASTEYVGTYNRSFRGMDFGPDNVLYGIDYLSNELYSIDTADVTETLIGSSVPATDHLWTSLAWDPTEGVMYANACWSIAAGSSKLYTIDLTDGSITLVGTQTTETYIGAMGVDDAGVLYGLALSSNSKIYIIDKTDGSLTLVGSVNEFGGAGMGYGMDFNPDDETMYVTAYDSFSFNNDLYTIDLTTGAATQVGSLVGWTYALAIISPFFAEFSADQTEICTGTTVNFTDESSGADSWDWTFEGGTPSSSTDQNPSVVYSNPGVYDVELEITNTAGSTVTELKSDYISVLETPAQANMPDGEASVCTDQFYTYSTDEVPYAQDYEWELTPADAGILTPNSYSADLQVADDWTGDFTISVRATNMCGDGDWSDNLDGTVFQSPNAFNLQGGGGYCLNGDGVEITLDGSESDIDYELYLNGEATGNIVEGTGSEISFGMITDEGFYTAVASNDNCDVNMNEQIEVEILFPPLEPGTPTGPEAVCTETTSDYSSEGTSDADSYEWVLEPEEAGTITSEELEATVEWNAEFSGIAMVSLYGINECGDGNSSIELEVSVGSPSPVIDGEAMVCDWSEEMYAVEDNEGSTYNWVATNGSITGGQGTYEVTVSWQGEGVGDLVVTEETADGCEGASELFMVTIDDCTNINENENNSNIELFPNPAIDFVTINSDILINSLIVLTQSGEFLIQHQMNSKRFKLNTNDLKPGVYLLKINYEKGSTTRKLIVN